VNPPRKTRISAYTILTRNGAILLCRSSSDTDAPAEWTLPGGGIEFGEDPASAAIREAKEETGFDVALGNILTIDSRLYRLPDADHHAIRIIYEASIIGGTLTAEANGSTDGCDWVSLDAAEDRPLVELAKVGIELAREQIALARSR
jgi:ADP-ribose pyrophosphatase YjhB (NUDIX family)